MPVKYPVSYLFNKSFQNFDALQGKYSTDLQNMSADLS